MAEWRTIGRPGYFGRQRDEISARYDAEHGKDNWRIVWGWKGESILFPEACLVYEEAYFNDSMRRQELWRELVRAASDVYDMDKTDCASGLDYLIQANTGTHIQDIAIRRVVARRGWRFTGDMPVRVRSKERWGRHLSPGRVRFHEPGHITVPHLEGWWDRDSVEDFYQSNKLLQKR
jgi:hypothetical protein